MAAACVARAISLEDGLAIVAGTAGERRLDVAEPRFAIVSDAEGRLATTAEMSDPAYWRSRPSSLSRAALEAVHRRGARGFIVVGAGDQLADRGRELLASPDTFWLASLRANEEARQSLLSTLADLYVRGIAVRWSEVEHGKRRRVALPTYPFQRERYWSDAVLPRGAGADADAVPGTAAWLHELNWRLAPLAPAPSELPHDIAGGCWLVFADTHGAGDAVAGRLRAAGARAVTVKAGAAFQRLSDDAFIVNPDEPEQVARLSRDAGIGVVEAIVYLASLDVPAVDGIADAAVQEAAVQAGARLLHVLQGIAAASQSPRPPRLWVVTREAPPLGDGAIDPVQASLSAVAATIATEHPDLRCTAVDVDLVEATAGNDSIAGLLFKELAGNDGRETRVAWRDGHRHVARLSPLAAPLGEDVRIRSDATYLVTGGAGGLGLQIAQWLAERGARHLVLVGRRGATGAAAEVVSALAATGCQVIVASGNVADRPFIDSLVAQISRDMPPLAGVIHAAGVLDDGVLLQQNAARLATVMQPKVAGAWNLHRATSRTPAARLLRAVLVGAVAHGVCRPGNYAAANAFLDALAHYRRRPGCRRRVDWSPWPGRHGGYGGPASPPAERRGRSELAPLAALEVLSRLAGPATGAQVTVCPVAWSMFAHCGVNGCKPAV